MLCEVLLGRLAIPARAEVAVGDSDDELWSGRAAESRTEGEGKGDEVDGGPSAWVVMKRSCAPIARRCAAMASR